MPKRIKVDGKVYSVPDDATDEEINQIVGPAPPQQSAFRRFATRALDLPEDLFEHPGAYLNPFSKQQLPSVDAYRAGFSGKTPTEFPIPGRQTVADIKAGNYAGAAGDVLPDALALAQTAQMARPGLRPVGRYLQNNAATAGEAMRHPIRSAAGALTEGAFRGGGRLLERMAGPEPSAPLARFVDVPPGSGVPTEGPSRARFIDVAPQSSAAPAPSQEVTPTQSFSPQPLSTEPAPVPSRSSWPPERPSAIQPRNFDSAADRLETRSLQEQMQDDLEQHGQQAYSQEKRDWFARNQPGSSKGDLQAQAQARRSLLEDMGHAEGQGIEGGSGTYVRPEEGGGFGTAQVPVEEDQDLVPKLMESIRQVQRAKGIAPRLQP